MYFIAGGSLVRYDIAVGKAQQLAAWYYDGTWPQWQVLDLANN